jgi:hypothetical protein
VWLSTLTDCPIFWSHIALVFAGKHVITLVDSWFMKWPYLQYVLQLGFHAILSGEKRYSPVWYSCFNRPRDKPGTYGDQYDAEAVNALPEIREGVFLYGKWQWVRYRSAVCLARLMKGRKVRAIWMQVEDENGALSKQRLNLSTLSDLLPQQIFVYYGRRWSRIFSTR